MWVEKDALVAVIQRPAVRNDVNFFACRGYVCQARGTARAIRRQRYARQGQRVVIIHLGDHDPSGIDMTRDVQDRLSMFGTSTEVRRIALNMDQVEQYDPPPNPAKMTDSRANDYADLHGYSSLGTRRARAQRHRRPGERRHRGPHRPAATHRRAA